jgi:hypothetical protein
LANRDDAKMNQEHQDREFHRDDGRVVLRINNEPELS